MAYSPWEDVAVPLLRGLIDDMDSPYTYDEDKLEELALKELHGEMSAYEKRRFNLLQKQLEKMYDRAE